MPEPVRLTQRRVRFGGTPAQEPMAIDHVPVVERNNSLLVSHPTNVAIFEEPSVGEHQRVWLVRAQLLYDFRKIVHMACAASAIEPELDEFAIVKGEFVQLCCIVTIVFSRVRIARFVAIPRGKINAKL